MKRIEFHASDNPCRRQSEGTTRETVSRLFSRFKKKQLLQLKGATLMIRNRSALEKMVNA
jgi:hypothetical protein